MTNDQDTKAPRHLVKALVSTDGQKGVKKYIYKKHIGLKGVKIEEWDEKS